jgi:hypothetical protein
MRTPSRRTTAPLKTAPALIALALVAACSGGGEPLPAEVVNVARSDGGRLEVSIQVTNDTDSYTEPKCTVRGFDADGYRKGTDLVSGGVLFAGESSVYSGVVGIDADGVSTVEVECSTG